MTPRVLVVGSLNLDLVAIVDQLPGPGETVLSRNFTNSPGGKGANQAVAAARLGADVALLGKVGLDPFGDALIENLRKNAVDVALVSRDTRASTGLALVSVARDGQNTIVVAPGANALLTSQDISAAKKAFAGVDVVILQLEIPLQAVKQAAELGKECGSQIILNPAPAVALDDSFAPLVDWIVPNEGELAVLSGLDSGNSVEKSVARLKDKGFQRVVVTMGDSGAFVMEGDHSVYSPAFPVIAVDTTGAGDAFVGAFSVALSEGRSVDEAVTWGNAAGALASTRLGAQPSLPLRKEVEELLEKGARKSPSILKAS